MLKLLCNDLYHLSCHNEPLLDKIFCTTEPNQSILTAHAEILSSKRSLDPAATALTLPIIIAKAAIARVVRREQVQQIKDSLKALLQ